MSNLPIVYHPAAKAIKNRDDDDDVAVNTTDIIATRGDDVYGEKKITKFLWNLLTFLLYLSNA